MEPFFKKPGFTEDIILKNNIDADNFKEWAFHPGMLFNSSVKWWTAGKRKKPHEGLDLCLYRDIQDNIHSLNEGAKVPAIYEGTVAGIIEDYIGRSIIVEHKISNDVYYSFYGHTVPGKNIAVGKIIKEGEIIAAISDTKKTKNKILPHLHVSLGRANKAVLNTELDWNLIADPNAIKLFDPIDYIVLKYNIFEYGKLEDIITFL